MTGVQQRFRLSLKYALLMLMLLILHIAGNAQKITSGKNIDSLTFALYQQNAWDSLIRAGTNAIQSGYDYYYMQMRVGIAWHQKTNYRKSVAYFRKALRLYPGDPVATGYLYYALLLGGRAEEAAHLAASQDSMMILRTRVSRPKFIEEVYLETGPGFPGYSDLNGKERTEHPADSIYNSSFYYNSVFYTHAGLRLNVRPWLNVYQGYSYLKSSFTQKLNFRGMVAPDFTETANQHEYYGNVRVHLPGGFLVTPAYHFISWKYDLRKDAYNPVFDVLTYDTSTITLNSHIVALSVKKHFGLFAGEISSSYSVFEHDDVVQFGLFGSVYPFGNTNLYGRSGVVLKSGSHTSDWIFKQLIGFSPARKLWLEVEATVGDLRDFNERNAFVVYNTPEKINYKIEWDLIYQLSHEVELSLRYRYAQRENSYLTYLDYENSTNISTTYPFHTFFLGIKWRL